MILVDIAQKIIQKEIPYIEGIHKLISQLSKLEIEEGEIFQNLRLIDSETDHLPVSETRKICSKVFLKRIYKTELLYENDILRVCKLIIEKYKD